MSNDIKIRKGLDIKLKGEAEKLVSDAPRSKNFAIKPTDFHGVTPKMVIKEGESVKAGDTIFYSKYSDRVKFVSPVSGTLKEIRRGAKRRILEVVIEADSADTYKEFGQKDVEKMSGDEVKEHLLEGGCWPFIKQRPYDIVANPEDTPKAIFISGLSTAPLAADVEFVLEKRKEEFQFGLQAISKLTTGKTHLCVDKKSASFLNEVKGVQLHTVSGPHPAGNVGVQIHHIDPINSGERVWVVSPEDVAIIGSFFKTGKFDATRVVAVAGTEAPKAQYFRFKIGTNVKEIIGQVPANVRIISGDVLTGDRISNDGFVGYYSSIISLIPEGNTYRMFGWLPFKDNNIPSMSKTSLSWLFPNKKYKVDTNLNGEERALVVTGEMEKVMPMDIYPMQLLKECMVLNIEKMENLGIHEVAPEDFALVDYVNTSKLEAQAIIREALDVMIKEVG
ncbi:Na(+)-translocating NADH-quinone reductase subunit A [Galbibacter pacificus]|uniref:Na(+)-translocating NADH-quinone reductase subunit A n=1 Tax=Galbibacter pacificus TaxID=2996052 RepID=A0ABT6FLW0_9FLAO|nr:Na(+)-translocating NADH-quinone reductase subunit A [Galbibacter pacificus]MDG3580771.1 Na(+)-translocating NADH-quinone reductase subunit A [Galbibacter pacificus]MDG3584249.1 Na(+)-translocating NADH-quinone reductase subunit A [Galbibacter pacificus]